MFISCLNNFIQDDGADLFYVGFEILRNDLIQLSYSFPKVRIEVIFDAIVSSEN